MCQVHLIKEDQAEGIPQTRIALRGCGSFDPLLLALGEEPKHRLSVELVVYLVEEAEHGFLGIPVGLNG